MTAYLGIKMGDTGPQPVYVEERVNGGDDRKQTPLQPRHDLANHSPDGFQWGYGGSGPAQLALAILAHQFDDETALEHYQDFKNDFVSDWSGNWYITETEIKDWLQSKIHDDY